MKKFMVSIFVIWLSAGAALPAVHEVKMLNSGEAGSMIFEPMLVHAEPGDIVRFIPTDAGHNVETVKGMIPDGVELFRSKVGHVYEMTVEQDGVYVLKCTLHFSMGMVAMIQVGEDHSNLDDIRTGRLPTRSRARIDALIPQLSD